jgi:prepilin-type N-terminal cleavage/methylation domain-containing protein
MARPVSTCITSDRRLRCSSGRGFTLVELMLASVLSAIVFAAIFSAYIFMARNLTRLANFQQQQVQDRQALYYVTKDVSDAVQLAAATTTSLVLTSSTGPVITYTYTPPIVSPFTPGVLTRQVDAGPSSVLLANLTSFTFAYYDKSGVATGLPSSIKQVEMRYTSAVGDKLNGTQASDAVISSRMVLRGVPSFGG